EASPLRKAFGLDEAWQDRVHADSVRAELGSRGPRERELGVLRGRVRPRLSRVDGPGDRDDVDDVRRCGRLERGEKGPQAPNAAEVVRPGHLLDPLGVRAEK